MEENGHRPIFSIFGSEFPIIRIQKKYPYYLITVDKEVPFGCTEVTCNVTFTLSQIVCGIHVRVPIRKRALFNRKQEIDSMSRSDAVPYLMHKLDYGMSVSYKEMYSVVSTLFYKIDAGAMTHYLFIKKVVSAGYSSKLLVCCINYWDKNHSLGSFQGLPLIAVLEALYAFGANRKLVVKAVAIMFKKFHMSHVMLTDHQFPVPFFRKLGCPKELEFLMIHTRNVESLVTDLSTIATPDSIYGVLKNGSSFYLRRLAKETGNHDLGLCSLQTDSALGSIRAAYDRKLDLNEIIPNAYHSYGKDARATMMGLITDSVHQCLSRTNIYGSSEVALRFLPENLFSTGWPTQNSQKFVDILEKLLRGQAHLLDDEVLKYLLTTNNSFSSDPLYRHSVLRCITNDTRIAQVLLRVTPDKGEIIAAFRKKRRTYKNAYATMLKRVLKERKKRKEK